MIATTGIPKSLALYDLASSFDSCLSAIQRIHQSDFVNTEPLHPQHDNDMNCVGDQAHTQSDVFNRLTLVTAIGEIVDTTSKLK